MLLRAPASASAFSRGALGNDLRKPRPGPRVCSRPRGVPASSPAQAQGRETHPPSIPTITGPGPERAPPPQTTGAFVVTPGHVHAEGPKRRAVNQCPPRSSVGALLFASLGSSSSVTSLSETAPRHGAHELSAVCTHVKASVCLTERACVRPASLGPE